MGLLSQKNKEVLTGPLNINNPVIVQMLGICSALAVTSKLEPAIVMGISVTAVVAVLSYRMLTPWPATPAGLVIAPFAMLLRWSLEMISWGTIIWAVLSWVNPGHPLTYTLSTMLDPFLRPCRRILPTVGGFDLSPVLLILAANVVLIFVTPLSRGALTF